MVVSAKLGEVGIQIAKGTGTKLEKSTSLVAFKMSALSAGVVSWVDGANDIQLSLQEIILENTTVPKENVSRAILAPHGLKGKDEQQILAEIKMTNDLMDIKAKVRASR